MTIAIDILLCLIFLGGVYWISDILVSGCVAFYLYIRRLILGKEGGW